MAGQQIPGHTCQYTKPVNTKDGGSALCATPQQGPDKGGGVSGAEKELILLGVWALKLWVRKIIRDERPIKVGSKEDILRMMDEERQYLPWVGSPVWTENHDLLYQKQVVAIINYYLRNNNSTNDPKATRFDILDAAHDAAQALRDDTNIPRSSESLLLRDVEHYQHGRIDIEVAHRWGWPRPVSMFGAPFVDALYNALKMGTRPANALLGTHWLEATIKQPASAVGGSVWFYMGIDHYSKYDKDKINVCSPPPLFPLEDLPLSI